MPTRTSYYPTRTGDQIVWLRNFADKIGGYQAPLAYTPAEVAAITADALRCLYLLETVGGAARSFAAAITAHIELVQEGPEASAPAALPTFALPTTPAPPAEVAPGALRRILAFVANLKTRPAYTDTIGRDLRLIGPAAEESADAVPPASVETRGGEVVLTFKKRGHLGVLIEGQIGAETAWTLLGIDTSSPYNDARPLRVPGQPENRRYRLCYWDGEPTRVWTPTYEVPFGG